VDPKEKKKTPRRKKNILKCTPLKYQHLMGKNFQERIKEDR